MDKPKNYKKRKTIMDDYINIIYKMLSDKIDPSIIYSYILYLGYNDKPKYLENYIYLFSKNNFGDSLYREFHSEIKYPDTVDVIRRNELLIYLTQRKEPEKRYPHIHKNIELLRETYPAIKAVEEVYNSFHSILMGNNPEALDKFIEQEFTYRGLISFVEGIKKDIAPIKNAISHQESSGFVEGNNNKFKLIKRILYGRSNLVNLFKKSYLAFLASTEDFNIIDIIKGSNITATT